MDGRVGERAGTALLTRRDAGVGGASVLSAHASTIFDHESDFMGFRCGIVGLPNVGKSTLFNALTETAAAQAANYPFCTIEPNVGNVAVPDPRLDKLAAIAGSAKIIETQLGFVDIAGLVRGASQGRRARQPVPRQHPRGRRDRPRAALLRG